MLQEKRRFRNIAMCGGVLLALSGCALQPEQPAPRVNGLYSYEIGGGYKAVNEPPCSARGFQRRAPGSAPGAGCSGRRGCA